MLDGYTGGPGTSSESIGKQLSGFVSEWNIAQFKAIPNPTFPTLAAVLSFGSDQYCAYKICTAIIQGKC